MFFFRNKYDSPCFTRYLITKCFAHAAWRHQIQHYFFIFSRLKITVNQINLFISFVFQFKIIKIYPYAIFRIIGAAFFHGMFRNKTDNFYRKNATSWSIEKKMQLQLTKMQLTIPITMLWDFLYFSFCWLFEIGQRSFEIKHKHIETNGKKIRRNKKIQSFP